MTIVYKQIQFRTSDISEVLEVMDTASEHKTSWITIEPWVDAANLPVTSLLRRLFSARGPKIPAITWVPQQGCNELGIKHAKGPNAFTRLIEAGLVMPEHFILLSDHAKSGIVFEFNNSVSNEEIIDFSLKAATVLAEVEIDDRWVCELATASH